PPTMDESCTWDQIGGNTPIHLTSQQWNDLMTPGTAIFNTWIGRLDTLAGYFQQIKDSGQAVMFRPLHEMNQCVFWWACHTGSNG
ncbi:glycosyl hydrolase, partial [Acinetobacter baumannii]